MLQRIVVGLIVAVVVAGGAVAGPLEEGKAAITRGDYTTALRLWRPLAEEGDAQAQFLFGYWSMHGDEIDTQALAEAVGWIRKAADQGLADAEDNLGTLFQAGFGVPQDYAEAAKWYRLAADQGLADAQERLGTKYSDGEGVTEDDVEAAKLWRLAADQGNSRAQFFLGIAYVQGDGVPKDYVAGYMWIDVAVPAKAGHDDWPVLALKEVGALMTPDQIAKRSVWHGSGSQRRSPDPTAARPSSRCTARTRASRST